MGGLAAAPALARHLSTFLLITDALAGRTCTLQHAACTVKEMLVLTVASSEPDSTCILSGAKRVVCTGLW